MLEEITENEMIAAIQRSGYLIEQRVAKKFEEENFSVVPNQVFVDPITNVRRELDLVAIKIDHDSDSQDFFGYEIICECENNQNPIVFFTHEFDRHRYVSELKCSGFESMWDLFKKFSEGVKRDGTIFTTQYCGFNKVKSKNSNGDKWIAFHADEQHDTLNKLKKSVQHRKRKFSASRLQADTIEGRIHFPLLVLKDHLYTWAEVEGCGQLNRVNHVIFRAQDFNEESNFYEDYNIDVIVEGYLPQYVKQKNDEWGFFQNIILKNRTSIIEDQIRRSIPMKSI